MAYQRRHGLLILNMICLIYSSTADDADIMSKFSDSISPTPSNWKTNKNYCDWEGILCDNSNRVTSIQLPSKFLNGTLPSDLNNLSQLKILDLQDNLLFGPLPTLANLTLLQEVYISYNWFTSIPVDFFLGLTNLQNFSITSNSYLKPWILPNDLTKCSNLRTFEARFASLNGTLTSDINNLSQLKILDLQDNSFSGPLPTLANLTLLQELYIEDNSFTSIPLDFFLGLSNLRNFSISINSYLEPWIIPNDLTQCTKLGTFYASSANIMGSLSDNINSLSSLQELDLSHNNLTGALPSNLNNLSQLKLLNLKNNSFSGPLPTLANMSLLDAVDLDSNKFTSIPVNFFLGLTNLKNFNISNNSGLKPWNLPEDLKKSTKLRRFYANNANIIGSIPDIFSSFFKLEELSLSFNNLSGTLPATFDRLGIRYLYLDNQLQGLSGTLDVISSMIQLQEVWLQTNAFTGVVPDLSRCTNLYDLQLSNNRLTGLVPESLTSLPNLGIISLENNKLQGPLPVFENSVNISLAINTNRFCLPTPGKCEPQVTALLEVARTLGYPLSLAESWRGNDACAEWNFVSCDSSKKKNVTHVNFEKQNFSGIISQSFANLTSLRSLSLNENNLTGSIPDILTSLRDLQLINVSNNNLSGRIPKFESKVKFLHKNNPLLGKHRGTVSVGMVIGSVISVLVFVGIVLLVSYKCYGVQTSRYHSEMPISESGNVMISIQLLKQVTNNFSDNNVLGRGGFGVVYKGELPNGSMIAVKRMKSDMMGTKGMNEFQAEIAVLTNVRHKHLVALLGYCINDKERLLVYEYMTQGTLSQHLFNWGEHKSAPLSWKQRVSIALDVGRGVEYLHSLAQQSFIHRDLKPDNILLDDDLRAKVADFGLVKNAPDGKHSMETRLAGTFGYLAPEYAATGRVTTKVDVFAFGVVLMQLITGLKALDKTKPDERYQLVTWFRKVPVSKETMVKFIDKVLDTDDNETLESILKVTELAGQCTANQPFQRPDMGYVVNVLGSLVELWKPSQRAEENTFHRYHMSLPEVLQTYEDTSRMLNNFRSNSF